MMLNIDNAGISGLLTDLLSDLAHFAPDQQAKERFEAVACSELLRRFEYKPQSVFTRHVDCQEGQKTGVLRISISDSIKSELAKAAKKFHGISSS